MILISRSMEASASGPLRAGRLISGGFPSGAVVGSSARAGMVLLDFFHLRAPPTMPATRTNVTVQLIIPKRLFLRNDDSRDIGQGF